MLHWLQRQSPLWPLALGSTLGLGIGAGALFGIGGIVGVGVCLVVLGTAFWCARDAEPVLVEVETSLAAPEATAVGTLEPEPEPEPEPALVEPLNMVDLPGGAFSMGSPAADADDNERPQHEVTVADFCISRYPITRQLYGEIVVQVPWARGQDDGDHRLPATYVSWFDAVTFCNALSKHVGLQPCYRIEGEQVEWDSNADGYRLPTEAEWEFACRAGTTSKWFFGDDPVVLDRYAWFRDNSGSKAQPVGAKEPNLWGLYDMIGNVLEWCWDWSGDYSAEMVSDPAGPEHGEFRALRGGPAWFAPRLLRSAARSWFRPVVRFDNFGFRCVRRPCR